MKDWTHKDGAWLSKGKTGSHADGGDDGHADLEKLKTPPAPKAGRKPKRKPRR